MVFWMDDRVAAMEIAVFFVCGCLGAAIVLWVVARMLHLSGQLLRWLSH